MGQLGGRAPQSRDAFSSSQIPHCMLCPVLVGLPCKATNQTTCTLCKPWEWSLFPPITLCWVPPRSPLAQLQPGSISYAVTVRKEKAQP